MHCTFDSGLYLEEIDSAVCLEVGMGWSWTCILPNVSMTMRKSDSLTMPVAKNDLHHPPETHHHHTGLDPRPQAMRPLPPHPHPHTSHAASLGSSHFVSTLR